jgi:hypothetical protein
MRAKKPPHCPYFLAAWSHQAADSFQVGISGRPITKAIEEASKKALRVPGLTKPITLHSLRHAFTVDLLERTVLINPGQFGTKRKRWRKE